MLTSIAHCHTWCCIDKASECVAWQTDNQRQETAVCETDGSAHDHVLQGVLGQPAVQKHWDEQVSEGGQNHLATDVMETQNKTHTNTHIQKVIINYV